MIGKRSVDEDDKPKTHRNPVLMLFAGVVLLGGVTLIVVGAVYFQAIGWLYATGAIAMGILLTIAALLTIITGENAILY